MAERIYIYPLWIRLWHIINALSCVILIFSGLSMQYAAAGSLLLPLPIAVKLHNVFGAVLLLSYLCFFIGNLFTANGKHYFIKNIFNKENIKKQFQYYTMGIFRKEKAPFKISSNDKFNPLQRVSYLLIMYVCTPIIIITGTIMMNPTVFETGSGFLLIDIIHILAGFLISLFLLIHIYFATIDGKKNFDAIKTGWHEID